MRRGANEEQQGTNGDGLQDPNDGEFLGQTVAWDDLESGGILEFLDMCKEMKSVSFQWLMMVNYG